MVKILEQTNSIGNTINELNRIFNLFNENLFQNKLEHPIIIIQSTRKNTLGTFSVNRIWESKNKWDKNDKKFEITITSEYLNRPIEDICATLLHEMIHLYCSVNNIKDTSNNHVYHNKNFKVYAEQHGLIIEHDKQIGWSLTTLNPLTKELIKSFNINEGLFNYYKQNKIKILKTKFTDLSPNEKIKILKDKIIKIQQKIEKLEVNNVDKT